MRIRNLLSMLIIALAMVVVGAVPSQAVQLSVTGTVNAPIDDVDNLGLVAGGSISGTVNYTGTPTGSGIESFTLDDFFFDFGVFEIDSTLATIHEALIYFTGGVFSGWGIDVDILLGGFDYQFAMTGSSAGTTSFDLYSYDNDLVVASGNIAPVPEPGTFLLLGAGLGGLVYFQRRRKQG